MRNPGLFEPDVLIAEVWGDAKRRSGALSSEKRLMLAVLYNAFDCYQKYMFADDRVGRELFEEAASWIECTSRDGLFSFESITEALDIEPTYFRRGLAEWHRRHVEAQRAGQQASPAPVSGANGAGTNGEITPPRLRSVARR
jgi:hypothetical protein